MKTTKYGPAIFSIAAKACLLSAAVLALCPTPVKAAEQESAKWKVNGELRLQSGVLVVMKLTQSGNQITGTAATLNKQGKVDGSVEGDAFTAKVTYGPSLSATKGSTAEYSGTIDEKGMITGSLIADGAKFRSESFSSVTALKRMSGTDDSSKKHKKKHKHHHDEDEDKSSDEH